MVKNDTSWRKRTSERYLKSIGIEALKKTLENLSNPYYPAWDAGRPNLIQRKAPRLQGAIFMVIPTGFEPVLPA